jgi:hypothetical protein
VVWSVLLTENQHKFLNSGDTMKIEKIELTRDEAIALIKIKLYGLDVLREYISQPKVVHGLYGNKLLSRKMAGVTITPVGEKIATKLIAANYMPLETRFYTRTI